MYLETETATTHRRTPSQPTSSNSLKRPKTSGLSRDQEIQYSFQIRTFRAAHRLKEQTSAQTESEWAAHCGMTIPNLRRVLMEGQIAREALAAANIGLVTFMAKKHMFQPANSLTLADLVQEGNLGLMEAAERFEPEKGFRFSTYAVWWIRQRIRRAMNDSSRMIRLPAHVHQTLQRISRTKLQLEQELQREPTADELGLALKMSAQKLQKYTGYSSRVVVVSLESPLRSGNNNDDYRTLGDIFASEAPTPEEETQAEYLRRDIQTTISELASRERDVLMVRFGLQDGKPRSVEETSQRLGMSRDRVRLLEARALNKLRSPQRNYRLKEYVNHMEEGVRGDRIWFF